MKQLKDLPFYHTVAVLSLFCWVFFLFIAPANSAVLYKSYMVKYDRGWDILCDPYVVQKDDWVYKIFRQKGELSANDFREFLSIFKRLNPHIHNIDRIRPNQHIIIPLKKIEPGTFPDQASGVVTIPFVTISKLSDLLSSYASTYQVQKGDSISKLIASRFGTYGTASYRQGVELFKSINPQVVDLNYIYVGQQLKLPDASVQNQAWYQSLFDKSGRIKKELTGSTLKASAPTMATADSTVKSSGDPISETAAMLDGKLLNRGTYFFPRKGKSDFELDLSRFPVLEMKDGSRIIFAEKTDSAKTDLDQLKTLWSKVNIVEIEKETPVDTILGAVLQKSDKDTAQTEISFSDHDMDVQVTAKWIQALPPDENGIVRKTCISPIDNIDQRTPDAIVRYLDQHHVVIKDLLNNEVTEDTPPATASSARFVVPDVITLIPINQKSFTKGLVEAMGNQYSKNITVTFPYAGIQVEAVSNLVSTSNGKEFLIDFGDLYGDAVQEIQKTGLEVVQIKQDDGPLILIDRILDAVALPYISDPVFYAAKRPTHFNTKMTIKGFLVTKSNGSKILISTIPLHNRVLQFLNQDDIKVILAGSPA